MACWNSSFTNGFPIVPSSFIEDFSFDYRKLQFIHLLHLNGPRKIGIENHWLSVEHRENPTYNRLATGMSFRTYFNHMGHEPKHAQHPESAKPEARAEGK